jgi:uncharacterized protein (DUF58 family)
MRSLWHRLRVSYEMGMRQQITLVGFLFSVLIVMVGLAAFVSANNLLFLLLAALLATFLISGFVSRLGLAGLELDLLLPEEIAARRPVVGRMLIKNTKWLPSFSVYVSGAPGSGMAQELYIPMLPGSATLDEAVTLTFQRRGQHREKTFYFSSRFPFGFTRRRAQVRIEREILVYPAIDPQEGFEALLADIAGEIEANQRGRGTDFYRIRPYVTSESARHVDWKATAHTGELQVREFARERDLTVAIYLDLEVPGHASEWFERAVDCCAFLVWRLSQQDMQLRFVTQEFDKRVPDEATPYTILRYLALVSPGGGGSTPLPDADRSYQIAFTANPDHTSEFGWNNARMVGLDQLPDLRTGSEPAGRPD